MTDLWFVVMAAAPAGKQPPPGGMFSSVVLPMIIIFFIIFHAGFTFFSPSISILFFKMMNLLNKMLS